MSLRYIFLISLVILFEYSYLTEPIVDKEYFKKNLKINKIIGEFKEGIIDDQKVFILFKTKKIPQSEGISSFTIKKKDPEYDIVYEFKTNCVQTDILLDDLISVKCDITYRDKEWDSRISYNHSHYVLGGNYDIINLRYFDEDIKQNSLLYIKEDDTKKEEKFIKDVNPKAIEGSEIGIYFDNDDCIPDGFIVLEDKNKIKRKFKASTMCQDYWFNNLYYQYQTFSLREFIHPGKYKIISIGNYNLKKKNDKTKEFYIEILEDIQKLIKIEGETYNEKGVELTLHFTNNTLLKGNDFTAMYLEDIKTGKIYDPKFEKLNIGNYDETIIKVILNFRNIPVGTYFLNYIYKKRKYEKIITITIKERESADYKIVKGNCAIETKDNPYCDFSFYSESNNKPINLEYLLIMKEHGSNVIHKINIKKCQKFNEDIDESEYTLRCTISSIEFNAYYPPKIYGNYMYFTLEEYKINDNIFSAGGPLGPYRFKIKTDNYFKNLY
jgi:hypothetical protein